MFRRKYFLSQKLTCFNFIDQILFLHKMTGHTLVIRLILQLYYVTKYNCILCSSDPHERDTLIVKKFDCTLSSNKGKIHIYDSIKGVFPWVLNRTEKIQYHTPHN